MTSNWTYTDETGEVVTRQLDALTTQSCLAADLPKGTQVDPYVAPIPLPEGAHVIPAVVTMRQARLALLQTGRLASVNAAVATADEATKITWEFSSEVQRNNALVSTLAAALNLTGQQLDDLFTLAATL